MNTPIHPPEVLYKDNDLIAVNKAPNLLTVPGRGPDKQDCLFNRILTNFPDSRVVHRLDMATSGIVLFPQSQQALSLLSRKFQERQVSKHYIAVVDGIVQQDNGTIEQPLICDWPNRPKQKVCYESGKPAKTLFQVLHRDHKNATSRLLLTPITGRSHQLRVHCEFIGHPILGDYFYGTPHSQNSSNRLLLHAQRISFEHPIFNVTVTITAPSPF
ncbi:pseudouridine synthase [Sessilibacter corallicola]|uniref:Bifunctional tRNA pseudouridine(32) synthase/23S rRNA pseudouridine(746) synthase RluA n=1 Tax=Sessilibacter corallicola TaxID=2904075 RepID=A0ABQ0A970_9GAMM